jgi:hypothetical protein
VDQDPEFDTICISLNSDIPTEGEMTFPSIQGISSEVLNLHPKLQSLVDVMWLCASRGGGRLRSYNWCFSIQKCWNKDKFMINQFRMALHTIIYEEVRKMVVWFERYTGWAIVWKSLIKMCDGSTHEWYGWYYTERFEMVIDIWQIYKTLGNVHTHTIARSSGVCTHNKNLQTLDRLVSHCSTVPSVTAIAW